MVTAQQSIPTETTANSGQSKPSVPPKLSLKKRSISATTGSGDVLWRDEQTCSVVSAMASAPRTPRSITPDLFIPFLSSGSKIPSTRKQEQASLPQAVASPKIEDLRYSPGALARDLRALTTTSSSSPRDEQESPLPSFVLNDWTNREKENIISYSAENSYGSIIFTPAKKQRVRLYPPVLPLKACNKGFHPSGSSEKINHKKGHTNSSFSTPPAGLHTAFVPIVRNPSPPAEETKRHHYHENSTSTYHEDRAAAPLCSFHSPISAIRRRLSGVAIVTVVGTTAASSSPSPRTVSEKTNDYDDDVRDPLAWAIPPIGGLLLDCTPPRSPPLPAVRRRRTRIELGEESPKRGLLTAISRRENHGTPLHFLTT